MLFYPERLKHAKANELTSKKRQALREQTVRVDRSRLNEPDYLANVLRQQKEAGLQQSKVGEEVQQVLDSGAMLADGLKSKAAYITEETQGVDLYRYMKHVLPTIYDKFL